MKLSNFTLFQTTLFIVLFVTFAGTVIAWSGPTAVAPNGNVSAPINVSSTAQAKSGYLGVNQSTSPLSALDVTGTILGDSLGITGNAIVSGNIGIGVTSPTQKLDVNGYVKGTGVCIGSDCRTAWPSGGVTASTIVTCTTGPTHGCTATCPSGYFLSGCSFGGYLSKAIPSGTDSCLGGKSAGGSGTVYTMCVK